MNHADNLTTREGVMRQLELGWNNLETDLAALTEEQQTHLKDAGGWTIKDHLSHLAIWEQGVLALLEGKSKREVMEIPPEIWEQGDDAINAVIQVRYGDWSLAEVLRLLRENHERVLNQFNTLTEADLLLPYRHYQPNSTDERPLIEWMPWETIYHYRDHQTWIAALVGKT